MLGELHVRLAHPPRAPEDVPPGSCEDHLHPWRALWSLFPEGQKWQWGWVLGLRGLMVDKGPGLRVWADDPGPRQEEPVGSR